MTNDITQEWVDCIRRNRCRPAARRGLGRRAGVASHSDRYAYKGAQLLGYLAKPLGDVTVSDLQAFVSTFDGMAPAMIRLADSDSSRFSLSAG